MALHCILIAAHVQALMLMPGKGCQGGLHAVSHAVTSSDYKQLHNGIYLHVTLQPDVSNFTRQVGLL